MYVTNFQYFCALISTMSVGFALGVSVVRFVEKV